MLELWVRVLSLLPAKMMSHQKVQWFLVAPIKDFALMANSFYGATVWVSMRNQNL